METDSAILPQDPPSAVARGIGWLLVVAALVAAITAVTVKIPETVRCRFVLVSQAGDETLPAPVQAVLVQVKAAEGAEVAKGAVLFVLRSDAIRDWQTQRSTQREELRALIARGAKLEEIQAAQVSAKDAQIVQLKQEVAFREKHAVTNRDFLANMETLEAQGGTAKIDMLNYRLNLAAAEKDLFVAQKSVLQASFELEQLTIERTRQGLDEKAEAEKLRIKLAALEQQLENCDGDTMFIRSPYDAVVVALAHRSGGSLISAGASLAQLARRDERPYARLQLDEAALARLQTGLPVRFFFEAFPYQRYGSVTGRLELITAAAVPSRETSQFMGTASLDRLSLPGAGQPLAVRVGMKGEARIRIGRRTLVEHIFEPIRQLRENLRP
jgi:multidrug efflux pump subunit AcrA (membrane-fusion protein)